MDRNPNASVRPAVVLLSGGWILWWWPAAPRGELHAVNALTIDYNQRHNREIDAARAIAGKLGVARHVVLPARPAPVWRLGADC